MIPANLHDIETNPSKEVDGNTGAHTVTVSQKEYINSRYKEFLPVWDHSQKYAPLKFHEYHDRGCYADPYFPNLLPQGIARVSDITPKLGSEVMNVQLSELSDAGKDELALLLAQRGVVIFRDQDFSSKGAKYAVDFARHFGEPHIHPFAGAANGFPELYIVYRDAQGDEFSTRNSFVNWHTDTSFESQPPGTTFLTILEGPAVGGDTIFSDTVEAYNRLSPSFKKLLDNLKVLHVSEGLAANPRVNVGGIERRAPVSNIHPLVRIHPVTRQKSIYVNRSFSKSIIGLKEEESRLLLDFLLKITETSPDIQMRAKWEPNTVVVWDNRRVIHSAIIDWDTPVSRHGYRLTSHAERPVENLEDLNRQDYLT